MRGPANLRRRIFNRTARVVVIGQGYVGLSLACAAAEAGFSVTGIDIDPGASTTSPARRRGRRRRAAVRSAVATGRLSFSASADAIAGSSWSSSASRRRCGTGPRSSPSMAPVRTVAIHLMAGSLVVLESTTYPGTTEQRVRPLLETSGMAAGRDFLLAYSPERIDPGNTEFTFREVPRVVGGMNAEATGVAASSTSNWSTRSWPCRRAAPPSWRSCWRTHSAT